jgi:hypothetical protein
MAGFQDVLMATLASAFQNPERDLGMSPESQYVRKGLGAMQAQGVRPELGGGSEAMPLIMQLIDALANSKPDRPKPPAQPQPQQPQNMAQEMQMLNTPGAASANSPENLALLQALLGR